MKGISLIAILITAAIVSFLFKKKSETLPKTAQEIATETGIKTKSLRDMPRATEKKLQSDLQKSLERVKRIETH